MRKLILLCSTMLCAMVLPISASPVHAQNLFWVASTGNDANNCSTLFPCATFQGAINKGGASQINCLSSGSYGPFTITASITVDCGAGNIGNVVVTGSAASAITLNTSSAATVVLRHLSVANFGTVSAGIGTTTFPSGTLIVEDCAIQGFTGFGINFVPSSGRGLLQVSNSQTFGNFNGIVVSPAGGQIASVSLNQVELVGNVSLGLGLTGAGIVAGTMRHSIAAGGGGTGVFTNASQVYFTIEESSIVANLTNGIETVSAGSVVNVGGSTIGGNGTGVKATAGQLISFGNNQMSANGTNGNFTSAAPLR